ncbi:MAG: tetratricopeptide repeat protein [Thermodesulfobacteriota bacterium]
MSKFNILVLSVFTTLALLLSGSYSGNDFTALAQDKSLGKVDFPVSCNKKAQKRLNRAVALLHHMMYAQAEKEFKNAADLDPQCAMAFWGIAMTQFHPLWAPPSRAELIKGQAAVNKAKKLEPETPREQDYISAVEAFYEGWDSKDHKTRIAAWSDGQKVVLDNNPNDIDAGAFYALSLLATAPKKDKEFKNQQKAGQILEDLHTKAKRHPGGFHYTIHAYDNPKLASRAVPIARGYDKLAPNVPHALHMPSHIFVRLGIWQDTIDWNIRSATAAEEQSSDVMSLHYIHAVDYLIYAYLQEGQYSKAEDLLNKVNGIEIYQDSFATAYGIAAAQSRSSMERMAWDEAANLPERTHTEFPWDKYPQYEAITYYAKGVGAARSGDTESAKKDKAKLDELYVATVNNGEQYWSVIVDAQRQTVDAWITYSGGNKDKGLQMMMTAADLEDSVDKHPVTPGSVMPARDMLGDMFLLSNKPGDALSAYEASLKISPNRFYSLYGAGYAAETAGDTEKAEKFYSELIDLRAKADSESDRVKHAKNYTQNN